MLSRLEGRRKKWAMDEEGRQEDDYRPDMPPLDDGRLVDFLFELGPTMAAGVGAGPITHGEIHDWKANTGVQLSGWEARALHRLSMAYLGESQRAQKRGCKPPWIAPDYKAEPTAQQVSLRASIKDK